MVRSNFCAMCGARIKDDTRRIRLVKVIGCRHEGSFPDNQSPENFVEEFCPNCYQLDNDGLADCPKCGRKCEPWW